MVKLIRNSQAGCVKCRIYHSIKVLLLYQPIFQFARPLINFALMYSLLPSYILYQKIHLPLPVVRSLLCEMIPLLQSMKRCYMIFLAPSVNTTQLIRLSLLVQKVAKINFLLSICRA